MSKKNHLSALILLSGLCAGTCSQATPATTDLGITHRVLSNGASLSLELHVRPARTMDRISLEAGSGVKSLTTDCHLEGAPQGIEQVCHVELTGTSTDAFMTLNVIGTNQASGGHLAQTEVQHLTFRNAALKKRVPTASAHRMAPPETDR